MKIFKYLFALSQLFKKTRAKWQMELDLEFLTKEHDTVFSKTEEQLREERAKIAERMKKFANNDKKKTELEIELAEIDRVLGRYGTIKQAYGATKDEIVLIGSYVNFLKRKCLK